MKKEPIILTIFIIAVAVLMFFLSPLIAGIMLNSGNPGKGDKELGIELVNALYEYKLTNLKSQDEKIRKLLSEQLYRKYTMGNDQRQLYVYLKFAEKQSYAINKTYVAPNRVFYNLEHDDIDITRQFCLEYKVSNGVVTDIFEYEVFPLPPSNLKTFYPELDK